ncbi:MAG: cytochrome ubiquinol oxidase subunit I [Candidatus Nanohaloarchaea archaeon]
MLDPVLLSRMQFALTTIVHIIFPVMSMGLAPFIVYFTWRSLRTDKKVYEQLRQFWLRLFSISFVVGSVTGVVLEFEFGTNFAAFSTMSGSLLGGPVALEGMMAFFLESTFLGILVFGKDKVSDRTYFLSSILVAVGSWLSAVWILMANSWMQTPRGYDIVMQNGHRIVKLIDPVAAYLNPRFPWMFVHMQNAAVLSIAVFIAGISAYHLLKDTEEKEFWRKSMKIGVIVLLVSAPFQVIQGDAYTRHVYRSQPEKFAAMEGVYHNSTDVGLYLFAAPSDPNQLTNLSARNLTGIEVPGMASFMASGYTNSSARIQGLDSFKGSPPVAIVFWGFRFMVALGMWFALLSLWSLYLIYKGDLFSSERLKKAFMYSTVLGFIGVEIGWMVTEVGRQPWTIQGILLTKNAVTPGLSGAHALLTLTGFAGGYLLLLGLFIYVVVKQIKNGVPEVDE